MKTALEWLEMEIVKLETEYAIPGNIYQLCEQAKEIEKQQFEKLKDFETWKEWKDL